MPTSQEIQDQHILLVTYRERLATYLKQMAIVGPAHVRPEIATGIQEARANIRRIKAILRAWNIDIQDHPDDEEYSGEESIAQEFKPPATTRTGQGDINIDVRNLQNSPIHIGDRFELPKSKKQIEIARTKKQIMTLLGIRIRTLNIILISVCGLAIGLFLSVYSLFHQPFSLTNSDIFTPFATMLIFAISGIIFSVGMLLHFQRVIHFLGVTVERGDDGTIYRSRIEGSCPRCTGKLHLRNREENQHKKLKLVCSRNPLQHVWDFDFTMLPPL